MAKQQQSAQQVQRGMQLLSAYFATYFAIAFVYPFVANEPLLKTLSCLSTNKMKKKQDKKENTQDVD